MKTIIENISIKHFDLKNVNPSWLLLLGILIMTISHLSWNIDLFAWVSMVPFLAYLNLTQGWKSRLTFFIVLIITWSLVVLKIISQPVPYFLIPLYSIPIALFHLPGYLMYGKFKKSRWSVLLFPAYMVILEWVQYSFTPLGSWGSAAYTQADSIVIAQTLSLFGMAGLGFIIYWINSAVTRIIITKKITWTDFSLPFSILLILLIFGHLRLDLSKTSGKSTIKVAAIGTDSDISGLPLPSEESNRDVINAIFQRTRIVSGVGVKLAVWNEAAFFLTPENEQRYLDSIALLASENNIAIVASYVVPISEKPFRFENKFVFYKPDGSISYQYLKHQPVPGEPAVKGLSPMVITNIENSGIGGAICYDYDFPYLARNNKKAGADIVAVPSSDWRGIDPLHTKMAAFRAIEQGHSIVRSTRFGLSASISPYGELIAQMSSFDSNNKILISNLPANGIRTIYSYFGDVFVYLCICFVIVMAFEAYFKNIKMNLKNSITS